MANSLIARNFEKFASVFSPSLSGGLLNLVFQPTSIPEVNTTVLKMNDINMDVMVSYVKELMLTTKQQHPVLEVLPTEVKPEQIQGSTYIIQLILLGIAFLLTIGLWIGTLVIPCTYCCAKKKRDSGGSSSKGCLIGMGVTTGVLVLFLVLCLPLVYVAITSLVAGIDGKSTDVENSGLKNTVHVVVRQTSEYLQQVPVQGRQVTYDLLQYAQDDLSQSLTNLVKKILNQLLTEYKVRELIDESEPLAGNITILQTIAKRLVSAQETTIKEVSDFHKTMKGQTESLKKQLNNLCPKTRPSQHLCDPFIGELSKIQFEFDGSKLQTKNIELLVQLTSMFGANLTEVLGMISSLQNNLNENIDQIITEIQTNFNVTEQLEPMLELWDKLGAEVSEPVIEQLNEMEPTVDNMLTMAAKFTRLGGYIILALFTVVLLIILAFGILVAVQAARESEGSRWYVLCGQIFPVVFCFLIPLLVLIAGILVFLSGFVTNEGCRYIGNPSGVPITDGVLNLYFQYMWPSLFSKENIDPEVLPLLDIPVPRNVLYGVLERCKVSSAGGVSEAPDPGLLPVMGVDKFLNVSAVTEQPQLKKAIDDAETALIARIKEINFNSILTVNVTEFQELINLLMKLLSEIDYTTTVSKLQNAVVDADKLIKLLDGIDEFANQVHNSQDKKNNIKTTTSKMRKQLENSANLNVKIMDLIKAFKDLQAFSPFTLEMKEFGQTLGEVYMMLTNKDQLEKPIRPIFQSNVKITLNELTTLLEGSATKFTTAVITCGNINAILTSVIGSTCANDGLINRFGGFFFMMLLYLCPLLLLVLFYQLFLQQHAKS